MTYNLQSKRLSKSNTIASRSDLKSMLMNDFKSHNYDESVFFSDEEKSLELDECVFELGPPKILRHATQIQTALTDPEPKNFKFKKFFELNLTDLFEGNVECEFCNCLTRKWPNQNVCKEDDVNDYLENFKLLKNKIYYLWKAYCCDDYKEYVQGIADCQESMKSLRKKMKFDYKTSSFVARAHRTSSLLKINLQKLRNLSKFYPNTTQRTAVTNNLNIVKEEVNIVKNLNEIQEKFQHLLSERKSDTASNSTLSTSDAKTKNRILYFLSNVKYVDRGWTILNSDNESNLYPQSNPNKKSIEYYPNTIDLWTARFTFPIIKNYNNGRLFQIIHTDRTGNIYYPNGRLAVLMSCSGNYRFFIAFSNDEIPVTLASFNSEGQGFCNYNNGKIRYQMNCTGGINFDQNGCCIKRWLFPLDSIKSSAFHPIIFSINEYMSIQIHNRFKILFKFRSHYGSCKFVIRLNNLISPETSEYSQFKSTPNETVCLRLKAKADNLLHIMQTYAQSPFIKKSNNQTKHFNTSIHSNFRFPPLNSKENQDSLIYSSKSTLIENASSVSRTSSEKNAMNNSIIFSLQDSLRS